MPKKGVVTSCMDLIEERAHNHFGVEISRPRVMYRLRGNSAGRYCPESGTIDFNRQFLTPNKEEFVKHTVPHEYAHHVVQVVHGEVAFVHGREWQGVMKDVFGLPPRITHRYEKALPPYVWSCGCQEHFFSRAIHIALIERTGEYACSTCHSTVNQFIRITGAG